MSTGTAAACGGIVPAARSPNGSKPRYAETLQSRRPVVALNRAPPCALPNAAGGSRRSIVTGSTVWQLIATGGFKTAMVRLPPSPLASTRLRWPRKPDATNGFERHATGSGAKPPPMLNGDVGSSS